jgi:F-type H+-transporting ATPase subunit b
MQEAPTTAGTVQPEPQSGGFPPFKAETFPSQLFWLAITFGFLFVVLWRFAGPRIQGVIAERRGRIADDIQTAEQHRKDSEAASAAYDQALATARGRAHAVADENRRKLAAEIETAKAAADAEAHTASAAAEARIVGMRTEARAHIQSAARDAAAEIVSRLTGETVSPDDAAAAVKAVSGA